MNKKKWLKIFIIVMVIALTATTVLASNPYTINSFWKEDPLNPGLPAPDPATDPTTVVDGWWWRDTTNQNAIADHSFDDYTGTVYKPYNLSGLTVMVYSSTNGPNVVALVTSSELLLIGAGGSSNGANNAKNAFQNAYPGFTSRRLRGIVLLDPSRESSWGINYWRNIFRSTPPVPLIVNAAYPGVKAKWDRVGSEMNRRQNAVYGNAVTSTSLLWGWGDDYFLGAGSMKQYTPNASSYTSPGVSDIYVTSQVYSSNAACGDNICWHTGGVTGFEFWLSGVIVDILATSDVDAGLLVDLPHQQIVISRDGGKFLPDVGSLYKPVVTVGERIKELNWSMYGSKGAFTTDPGTWELSTATNTNILIPAYGLPISGAQNVQDALIAQRSALKYLHDQTVQQINLGTPLEGIVATVQLPSDLAASSYNQEFTSTTAFIIHSVYQEYMGWFGGEPDEMAGSLSPGAKAQVLADALGGVNALASAARQAELNARDLPGAEKALYLAHSAYLLAPNDFTVKEVYAQALRKIAYMQKSAQVRNYYLSLARGLGTEQVVTSFSKSGDEDIPVAFTAAEFSQHFSGISGGTLTWVEIVSLPSAGNGFLTLQDTDESGNPISVPVTEGQTISVVNLDGLVFSPADNWNGDTSFLWNGMDGGDFCDNDATVAITIHPVNDAPVVSATPLLDVIVDEDAADSMIDLAAGFSDVDIATNSDTLTFVATSSDPSLVSAAVEGATLTLDYQENQNGTATTSVTATDAAGLAVTDVFTVTVIPVNDAPVCIGVTLTTIEDTAGEALPSCTDVDEDALTYAIAEAATHGNATIESGKLQYVSTADFSGDDSFTYTANDSQIDSNTATVTVSVSPVNDAPMITEGATTGVTMDEDNSPIPFALTLHATDADAGDTLTWSISTLASRGTATASGTGTSKVVGYMPITNYNGADSFVVQVSDGNGVSDTITVDVTIQPVNDAPTAQDAQITVVAGKSQTITLSYGDIETAQANLQVTFSLLNGTLDTSSLPALKYTAPLTAGDDSFTYTVTDRGDPDGCTTAPCAARLSTTATIHVTVLAAPSGSISGLVFNDADGDGILDAGEAGLAGVTVELKDAGGSVLETATTAVDGNYAFTGLEGGTYQVRQSLLPGSVSTTPQQVDLTLAEAQAQTVNFGQVVSADLRVSMTVSVNGKQIIYAITVTNDGPADALNAILTDTLPDGTSFLSIIATQGTCGGGKNVNCNFGTIASGGSVTVTVKVNRTNTKIAIVNTAVVSSSTFDIDPADNSVTQTVN
jgi:uncharacterized repeat protein (TIGR01451 family)